MEKKEEDVDVDEDEDDEEEDIRMSDKFPCNLNASSCCPSFLAKYYLRTAMPVQRPTMKSGQQWSRTWTEGSLNQCHVFGSKLRHFNFVNIWQRPAHI